MKGAAGNVTANTHGSVGIFATDGVVGCAIASSQLEIFSWQALLSSGRHLAEPGIKKNKRLAHAFSRNAADAPTGAKPEKRRRVRALKRQLACQ